MQFFLPLFLLYPVFLSAQLQNNWILKKDKQGIQIYTRSKSNSKFKEFKAVASVKSTVPVLVAVMKDSSAYKELFPLTMDMQLLQEKGETYQIQYVKTDVPFPVADRDGIYEFQYSFDRQEKSVLIQVKVLKDYLPEQKKMVRISAGEGFWKFTPKPDNMVEIVYQFHAEPGGNIPAWLANSQVVDSPWQAMTGLLRMMEKEKYQNISFGFMK